MPHNADLTHSVGNCNGSLHPHRWIIARIICQIYDVVKQWSVNLMLQTVQQLFRESFYINIIFCLYPLHNVSFLQVVINTLKMFIMCYLSCIKRTVLYSKCFSILSIQASFIFCDTALVIKNNIFLLFFCFFSPSSFSRVGWAGRGRGW